MRSYSGMGLAGAVIALGLAIANTPAFARDETVSGKMSTAKTTDVINTLRSRGSFHRMLEGLENAYDMDNTLKGKGPFTVFACDDKGWDKLNQADQDTLFNNKKKLAQVFSYEVLQGEQLNSQALEAMSGAKSMEGHQIHFSMHKDEGKNKDGLYANNSRIKTADIKCSNGVIHITDTPLMPPLAQ
jgi:uncharacterized surface protein with fasciclin (FAS1) repeats